MKYILLLLIIIVFPLIANAQFKPSEQQELSKHNAIVNGGFENGKKAWTLGTGNTLAFGSTELLNQHGSVSVSGNILDISNFTTKLAEFPNMAAMARCKINTSVSGINFQLLNNSGVVSELSVIGDGTWRDYQIPMVTDATLNAVKVVSDTSTVATVLIDDCYIELGPTTQTVGQAHFVGKLDLSNDCVYSRAALGYDFLLDNDSTCSATSATGGVSLPTNTNRAGIKILNPRHDGVYRIAYNGLLYKSGVAGHCEFTVSKTILQSDNGEAFIGTAITNNSLSSITGDIKFSSDEDEVYIIATSSAGDTCTVYGSSNDGGTISAHFFPDSAATIVSQDTELTAKTVNEFSAIIAADGTVTSENYDFIDGDCTYSGGLINCTYNTGIFTQEPSTGCIVVNTSGATVSVCEHQPTNSSLIFVAKTQESSPTIINNIEAITHITVSKQGADVNRSATIVGKFENINDTPINFVQAKADGTQTLTHAVPATVKFQIEEYDNGNTYDHLTGITTVQRDGSYDIKAQIDYGTFSATATMTINLFVNGVSHTFRHCLTHTTNFLWYCTISKTVRLNAGDTIEIVATQNTGVTQTIHSTTTFLSIDEQPDLSAVVKNLATDSKIKCQRKYLAAQATTTGIVPDLTFNNLKPSRRYSIGGKFHFASSDAGSNEKYIIVSAYNGATILDTYYSQINPIVNARTTVNPNVTFTAVATTLEFNINVLARFTMAGGGTNSNTFIELCELPSTFVETTEF